MGRRKEDPGANLSLLPAKRLARSAAVASTGPQPCSQHVNPVLAPEIRPPACLQIGDVSSVLLKCDSVALIANFGHCVQGLGHTCHLVSCHEIQTVLCDHRDYALPCVRQHPSISGCEHLSLA